jgi:hypothetical protein
MIVRALDEQDGRRLLVDIGDGACNRSSSAVQGADPQSR